MTMQCSACGLRRWIIVGQESVSPHRVEQGLGYKCSAGAPCCPACPPMLYMWHLLGCSHCWKVFKAAELKLEPR